MNLKFDNYMTAEEILIEAKHKEIIANAKFEAFEKVIQQTKKEQERVDLFRI